MAKKKLNDGVVKNNSIANQNNTGVVFTSSWQNYNANETAFFPAARAEWLVETIKVAEYKDKSKRKKEKEEPVKEEAPSSTEDEGTGEESNDESNDGFEIG